MFKFNLSPKLKNKSSNAKIYKILTGVCFGVAIVVCLGFLVVFANPDSVGDAFDTPEKIASRANLTLCSGQAKLAESTWTTLNECNCNSLEGWYWHTTNGRSACWSKTLADSVSWNKGVGNDVDNPGVYTCAEDITALKDRMVAASAGEWYKIVSNVAGTTITSSHNGSAGYSVISALAVSDCLDGTRDLCEGDNCLGADVAAVNVSLSDWAIEAGNKSALSYCVGGDCSTQVKNDFWDACSQNTVNNLPLNCYNHLFYKNEKTCEDGDVNNNWSAAAISAAAARVLGSSSCSSVGNFNASATYSYSSFRVVVRP